MPLDDILPQSLEAEQSTLGSILIEPSMLGKVAEILQPTDFFRDAHRVIFESMLALMERGEAIDSVSVAEHLRNLRDLSGGSGLENVGGMPYLAQLLQTSPNASNAPFYAEVVREKAVRRWLIDAGSQIGAVALDECEEIEDLLTRSEAIVTGISQRFQGQKLLIGEIGADELPESKEIAEVWFGLYLGRSHLLIGQSDAGKSTFVYNFVIQAARNQPLLDIKFRLGRPAMILYIDPENAGDYRSEVKDGGLCRRKLDRIMRPDETGEVRPSNLRFMDGEDLDLSQQAHMRKLERRILAGHRGVSFDVVILDPVAALFRVKDENDNAEMGQVSKSVRMLARRTGAAILYHHHTGKPSLRPTSGLQAGRGASALADHADVVMTWRARGSDRESVNDEYQGAVRERRDVCQLRIWKDRPSQFGHSALYCRMIGYDRFEVASFDDWRAAARSGEGASKEEQARQAVLDFLADGEWQGRKAILDALKKEEIGRTNTDTALAQLLDDKEIESRRWTGASVFYRIPPAAGSTENQFPNFPISQFPNEIPGAEHKSESDSRPQTPLSSEEGEQAAHDSRSNPKNSLGNWEIGKLGNQENGEEGQPLQHVEEFTEGLPDPWADGDDEEQKGHSQ